MSAADGTFIPSEVERDVRALLDAMDRMYGRTDLSENVRNAASQLRTWFPYELDEADASSGPPSA